MPRASSKTFSVDYIICFDLYDGDGELAPKSI